MPNYLIICSLLIMGLAAFVEAASISEQSEILDKPLDVATPKRKRQWESNMRVWGKRSQPVDGLHEDKDDKRSWNNDGGRLRVWGKRQWSSNDMRVWGKRSPNGLQKRQWSGNDMRVWGKRQWSDNSKSMRVWGKRSGPNTNSRNLQKRGWDTRSIPVWGKR